MDVRDILHRARGEAGLDQRRLALAAGTARTTVVAYETGARSPTVRQLTRLLAACGLQARVTLEPLGVAVVELLAQARAAGPPRAFESVGRLASSLDTWHVSWALDGASAVAASGLRVPHDAPVVVVVDDETTRSWLRRVWARGWDRHGFLVAPSWTEDGERVRELTRSPVYTIPSFVHLRWVEELPPQVETLEVEGCRMPVLPLEEVRRAWPAMDELLRCAQAQDPPG